MGSQNSKNGRVIPVINESLGSEAHEQFRYLLGRRFHNVTDIIYDLPNDEIEVTQLEAGCNVLDVGCGPGTWTIEMAINYNKSTFVGIDVSPIFPTEIKPNNAIFEEKNILNGIPHPDESFDFVHMRYMFPSFTKNQWEEMVINEVVRVIKIGGWLELCEYELCQNCGPVLESLLSARRKMLIMEGRNPDVAQILGKLMRNTQYFDDVIAVLFPNLFINLDPPQKKRCSNWFMGWQDRRSDNIITRMVGIKPALSPFMNITSEEYDEMIQKSIEEFNEYRTFFVTFR
ncbi:8080_t:CDS:2, partial [Racocetra persica]